MGYHYRGTQHSTPEHTNAERIRDAAIDLFGRHGFTAVTIKNIAEQAGVSPPLVMHHFGSKAGLRTACDRYVAQRIHASKIAAMSTGAGIGPEHLLTQMHEGAPILRYLFHALVAGGEGIDALVDQLVDDALEYTTQAEKAGVVTPSVNAHHRAAVILLWSFGGMMLHRHMKRLIGTSLVDDPPEKWGPYIDTVLEIYTNGVLTPGVFDHLSSNGSAGSSTPPSPSNSTNHAGKAQ